MSHGDTKIVNHSARTIAGLQIITSSSFDVENFEMKDVPQLWELFWKRFPELNIEPNGTCFAVASPVGQEVPPLKVHYLAGVEVDPEAELPEGFVAIDVPAGNYLHFTHQGSFATLDNSFREVYLTWFPKSGLVQRVAPHIEMYDHRSAAPETDTAEMDILIPVE